jgi:xanthine dehydrogenase accessory factor
MRADLAERAAELTAAQLPYVQATVVRAQSPTSATAGDAALVLADGRVEGFVGGTCAETSVQVHGLEALQTGQPLLLRILPGAEHTVREQGAVTVSNPCLSGGALEIFLEPRRPAPRVTVVGDTPIARSLVELGGPLGFAVSSGAGPAEGDAALVVASHGRGEQPALEAALREGVPYVALVASRVRGAAVVAALDAPDRDRVRTPAGLPIGARTAPEIALSILAEMVASRAAPPPATEPAAVDPVCGMTVAIAPGAPSVERDGGTFWFCCEHCRAAFADA